MNKLVVMTVFATILVISGCQNSGTNSTGALLETGERTGQNTIATEKTPKDTGSQVSSGPHEFNFIQRVGFKVRTENAVVDSIYGWSVSNGDVNIEPNHLLDSELRMRVDNDEDFDLYIRYRPGDDNVFVLTAGGSQDDGVPQGLPESHFTYTGKSLIVYSDGTVEKGTLTAEFDFSKATGDIRGETENSEFEMFVRVENDSVNLSLIEGWFENSEDERQSLLLRGALYNSGSDGYKAEGLSGVFNAVDNTAAGAFIGRKDREPQLKIFKDADGEETEGLELFASIGRDFQSSVSGEDVTLTGYVLGNVVDVFSLNYREKTDYTAENGWQIQSEPVGDGNDHIVQMQLFTNEGRGAYIMRTSGAAPDFSAGLPSGQFTYGDESSVFYWEDNGRILLLDGSVKGRVDFGSKVVDVVIESEALRFNALNMELANDGFFETETGEFRRKEDSEWVSIDPNEANLYGNLNGAGEGMSGVFYSDGNLRGIAGLFAAKQNSK